MITLADRLTLNRWGDLGLHEHTKLQDRNSRGRLVLDSGWRCSPARALPTMASSYRHWPLSAGRKADGKGLSRTVSLNGIITYRKHRRRCGLDDRTFVTMAIRASKRRAPSSKCRTLMAARSERFARSQRFPETPDPIVVALPASTGKKSSGLSFPQRLG
jgi:hypothetical protein